MRFLSSIILTIVLSGAAAYFLPWWIIAVMAFLVATLLKQAPGKAFIAGFLSIAILWLGWSLRADINNDHILSQRMAMLFHLPGSATFLIVAAIVGGIVGGMAAWTGALAGRLIR